MRLSFLGCGTKGLLHQFGNNAAFMRAHNQGNNMLLLDCGGHTDKAIEKTDTLEGVDNLVAFFSHVHPDHIDKAPYLFDACGQRGINLNIMLPTHYEQRDQTRTALVEMGIRRKDIKEIQPHVAAAMMNLDAIEMKPINHSGRIKTTALIMKQRPYGRRLHTRTIFAADHLDEEFIRSVVDEQEHLDDLYTDCTTNDNSKAHFPFSKLRELIPLKLRTSVTLMHMNELKLPFIARMEGFNTADEYLVKPKVGYNNNYEGFSGGYKGERKERNEFHRPPNNQRTCH